MKLTKDGVMWHTVSQKDGEVLRRYIRTLDKILRTDLWYTTVMGDNNHNVVRIIVDWNHPPFSAVR